MNQKIVRVLNKVLFLLVAVFSVGYFAGIEVEKVSAAAPTGFISQTYEDSDGNGVIDQVVIVINGDEDLTTCSVTDAEVGTDWTYVGNDIGGSLASSGETHSCDLATETVTLKITGANANITGHTTAPTIAYDNDDTDNSIANATGNLGTVAVANITDGAAPVAISSDYKDTDLNGTVDRVDVTYSENIESSTFTTGEWSFPVNIDTLTISSGTFLATDVLIEVTDAPADSTVLDDTTIKYTAGTGITDGANAATTSAELSVNDKAQPIILTAVDQSTTSLDNGTDIPIDANIIITFSEPMDPTTLDENTEWSISPNPGSWENPSWSNEDKTLTLEQTVNFDLDDIVEVTLSNPLAVSGVDEEDRELQDNPNDAAVDNSFTFEITNDVDEDEVEDEITPPTGYLPGPTIPNPNSGVTLYRMPNDPRVYVIKNKKKRWIHTPKEFETNGYKWNEIQEISAELLEKYPDAEDLVTELLRAIGDYKVYKLEGGKKHWIRTAGEFNAAGYSWDEIQEVSSETLASYQNAVLSELLRAVGDHKVYKLKGGKKHWIRTAGEFNAAGYNWEDVEEVTAETLDDYPDSETL